jgi:hypothetical protein
MVLMCFRPSFLPPFKGRGTFYMRQFFLSVAETKDGELKKLRVFEKDGNVDSTETNKKIIEKNNRNHKTGNSELGPDSPQFFIVQHRRSVSGFDYGVNGDKA